MRTSVDERPQGRLRVLPLFAFFAGRRPDRVQLVFLTLYSIGAIHLSFFSLGDRTPIEARQWLLSSWIPLLLPIWLVDGGMNRRGSVRLFVWPRSGLVPVILAYILARSARAVVLAIAVALLALNTELAGGKGGFGAVVACGLMGLFVSSFVTFWNVVVGARTVYPAVYAAAMILFWLYSRIADHRVAAALAQWLVLPLWVLDPVTASMEMGDPLGVLPVCSASVAWYAATWLVMHRNYR